MQHDAAVGHLLKRCEHRIDCRLCARHYQHACTRRHREKVWRGKSWWRGVKEPGIAMLVEEGGTGLFRCFVLSLPGPCAFLSFLHLAVVEV
eukprot:304904-Chlamydomonas_euryale.AAC.1